MQKQIMSAVIAAGLGIFLFSITSTVSAPQDAEQKSVIEEQTTALAGVSLALYNTEINISVDTEEKEQITATYEEEKIEYSEGWTNTSVNVRTEPNTDSAILETYACNIKVLYNSMDNGWSQIIYNDGIAYIKSEYISDTEIQYSNPYTELIYSLTDYEKNLIYQTTYAEAGNQSMEGQRAVIEVILNRVMSNKFPDTVYGVLSQENQFSTWYVLNTLYHNEEQEEALELVATEPPILTTDYMMFSLGKFSWANNYIKIGDHWFGTF